MAVTLMFPDTDVRSTRPAPKRRPWLYQGARGEIVVIKRRFIQHTICVQFDKAPKGDYDLVSREFLKRSKK